MVRIVLAALVVGILLGLLGAGAGIASYEATGQGRIFRRAVPAAGGADRGVTPVSGGLNRTPVPSPVVRQPTVTSPPLLAPPPSATPVPEWQWTSPARVDWRLLGNMLVIVDGRYSGRSRVRINIGNLRLVNSAQGRAYEPNVGLSAQESRLPGQDLDVDPESIVTLRLIFPELPVGDGLHITGLPGIAELPVN
jgi:hypothetical protein